MLSKKIITKLWRVLTGLIVIGIIVYLGLLYQTSQSISADVKSIDGIRWIEFPDKIRIVFTLEVNNTGVVDVTIEKLYYRVYIENEYLGDGIEENILIMRGRSLIEVSFDTSVKHLSTGLIRILMQGGRFNVKIDGYIVIPIKSFGIIRLWSAEVPFIHSFEFSIV